LKEPVARRTDTPVPPSTDELKGRILAREKQKSKQSRSMTAEDFIITDTPAAQKKRKKGEEEQAADLKKQPTRENKKLKLF